MSRLQTLGLCATICLLILQTSATGESVSLFDGKSLAGWKGDSKIWSVRDGAITGVTTDDDPISENTFLIWQDGEVADFRLRLKYRIRDGNSGIQYRSKVVDPAKFIVGGYQADMEAGPDYTGILYEERGRGILALRGQQVQIDSSGEKTAKEFAKAKELQKKIHTDDAWNEYLVEAIGPTLRHYINGQLMSEVHDEEQGEHSAAGVLALQVHRGPEMTVQFKDIELEIVEEEPSAEDKRRN